MPNSLQLPSHDLQRTEKFFSGFSAHQDKAGLLIVDIDDKTKLQFWQISSKLISGTQCIVPVKSLRRLADLFVERGLSFVTEEQPRGMAELRLNDPDGNSIRFIQS